MNCDRCDIQLTSQFQRFRGHYYLIENVPMLVCPRCGAEYVTPETHDVLLTYLQGEPKPVHSETLEFLDLSLAV